MAGHGRYTIVSKLADGGMAEIFLGIQHGAEGFQKPVVLKRILTAFSADPQFRNMFLDEAHISMSLNHSNIVQVLDLGVSRGRYFLVLELVDGWDLDKILQRAKIATITWPPALSLYVVGEVCRALSFAHGKVINGKPLGIVHRDISPNNVLISEQGEVKLADFGIAKAQRKREQTAAGVIKGKIAFMSPEQATGAAIDRRSDLFAVGSMLYLMATDKLPFESATDLEAIFRVQRAEFTPPETARPGVGTEVSRIIMRAMRLVPGERYQTADEMLVDVERVLRTEYQSAGQTELKLWMAQLARRDGSQAIGKTQPGTLATVTEGGTDVSVGASFELVDFDDAIELTEGSFIPGAVVDGGAPSGSGALAPAAAAGKGPPPLPTPTPPGGAPIGIESMPPPRVTGTVRAVENKSRGLRGFWFGATFALAAVIGARYVIEWARTQPFFPGGGPPAPVYGPPAPPPVAPAPPPGTVAAPAPAARPGEPPPPARPQEPLPREPVPGALAAGDAGGSAAPAPAAAGASAGKPDASGAAPVVKIDSPGEPDEEALLRQALPNAETAVIGEEEADEPAPDVKAAKGAAAKSPNKAAGDKKDERAGGLAKAMGGPAKPETVSLHITSSPVGAVVRTKYKVLGRTPISLHFRGGNTYELMFIKQGYAQATKRVTIAGSGAKDRKVAVTLKKSRAPSARPGLFRIHR